MKAVSLFAGVGGFDLALERAGVTVVASCEIDKYAQKVLGEHFPNSTIISDVKDVTGDQLKQLGFDGNDGIIVGGFPCQDLSVAGKRAGLAGARSGLFWEICRILDETKAKWFVLENVPGLLSSNDGRDMGTVIGALVERGYGVAYRILDAQYFGVAQRRRRVFIVGCLGDDGRASAEVLSLVEGMRGHHSQSNKAGKETPRSADESASETSIKYPKRVGTITTAFGAKNYSNHQELMEGSVVVYDELVHQESQSTER
jgi:DNA (cytosine-5)-methyltransferase 1